MGDIVVPIVIESIKLVAHEANLLLQVKDQVSVLENDLQFMNAFLENSAAKRNANDDLFKELVNQIRDVALQSEDVIDTYIAQFIKQRRRNLLVKLFYCFGHASMLHGVANETTRIKNMIENIYDNQAKYGIGSEAEHPPGGVNAEAEQSLLHRRRINVEEDDVVGFDNDTMVLFNQLTDPTKLRMEVISIVGMGGLGKTTLAKKIYSDARVKNDFDCCAWIYISHEYKGKKSVLLEILKLFMPISDIMKIILYAEIKEKGEMKRTKTKTTLPDEMHKQPNIEESKANQLQLDKLHQLVSAVEESKENLEEHMHKISDKKLEAALHDYLKGKRYFIVMDDIWNILVWEDLKTAFPDDLNRSRILITSRDKEVALHASPTLPYVLPFLDKDASWELLRKKVFRGEECCRSNLEALGRELAESCKGLPLSVVLLGGILASKEKSPRIWNNFIGNVNSYLTEGISNLTLSYNHLPRHLKSCFLYLGLFPEKFEISTKELTELWIAEGFIIKQIGNRTVNDIAEEYLEQLIDRSLLQVASRRSDGGVKTCFIHDILRDLCIRESNMEKFMEIYLKQNGPSTSRSRRVSFQYLDCQYFSNLSLEPPCARSMLLFEDGSTFMPDDVFKRICKRTKFIRVLYLSEVYVSRIPCQIDELVLLRCLWINNGTFANVPSSICNLLYLETIHLGTKISSQLPKDIWLIMKQLRHLYMFKELKLPLPSRTMGEPFWNLHTLSHLYVDSNTALFIDKFPNLRKLCLEFNDHNGPHVSESEVEKVMSSIGKLEYLQSLKLDFCLIEDYHMNVRLNSFPSRLTKLSLKYSYIDSDHFKAIARLPHLFVLKLRSEVDWQLQRPYDLGVIATGDFPQLQVLKMKNMGMQTWKMEIGAMQNLQHLDIEGCGGLTYLPSELWCITTLQLVHVSKVSEHLKDMLSKLKLNNSQCKLVVY